MTNNAEALVALAPREPVSLDLFNLLREQAQFLIKSEFLPAHITTAEQAVAVVLIGREIGIPMMQALRKVFIIQKTPALAAELMLALAERTGELEDLKIEDDGTACTVMIKRKGRKSPVSTTFSAKDADAMQLSGKDNWKKQPTVMRRWRAISANLRLSFPDAIGGMYSVDEVAPELPLDERGSPIALPPAPEVVAASLMPRKVGETPPVLTGPVVRDPEQETREILEAMLGEDVLAAQPGQPGSARVVGPEPGPLADTETAAQPELPRGPASPPAREPVRFTIGKTPYETAGITRDQMLSSFDLETQVEKKQKGLTRTILKSFQVAHRWELTEEQGEQFLIRLAETLGIDPPWVKRPANGKR